MIGARRRRSPAEKTIARPAGRLEGDRVKLEANGGGGRRSGVRAASI